MGTRIQSQSLSISASLLASCGLMFLGCSGLFAQEGSLSLESRAANAVGSGDVAVLSLIRELSAWKERALRAEDLLSKAGVPTGKTSDVAGPRSSSSLSQVLSTIEEERVLILSLGREKGVMQGALVAVGRDVVAKVIESRETISAAVVDSSYKGKLVTLEGLPVKLAVR